MAQPLINISRRQTLFFAAFLVMYEFLTYIANDMILPGMISVIKTFHGVEADISLSLTVYILGGASLQLILGPLSDRYGRRPVMMIGASLFFIFTVVIACSGSMLQFMIARFFEGMGLCFICVVGYATLQEIFEEMDAVRLMAIMANISILAPLLGPLAGAVFVSYFSWRYIFILIAGFALVALFGLWCFMPESVGQLKRDGTVIQRVPLLPKVILRNYKELLINPVFILSSIALGLAGLPCVAWIALAPVILVTVGKVSLIYYGLWQLPVFTATILGNMVLHKLTRWLSLRQLLALGTAIVSVGLLLTFIVPLWRGEYFIYLLPGLIMYFFGLGIIGSPLSRFVLFSTEVAKGTASALMSMILMCVQALGIQIANGFYASHSNLLLGLYCLIVGILFFTVVWITAFWLQPRLMQLPAT